MKTELQDKLTEVITAIQGATGKASDFALDQMPDIAQQYVTYGRVVDTISLISMLAITSGGVWLTYISWKKFREDDDWMPALMLSGFITGVATFISCVVFASAAMAWFAPKIFLIKGLAGLLK